RGAARASEPSTGGRVSATRFRGPSRDGPTIEPGGNRAESRKSGKKDGPTRPDLTHFADVGSRTPPCGERNSPRSPDWCRSEDTAVRVSLLTFVRPAAFVMTGLTALAVALGHGVSRQPESRSPAPVR